VKNRKEEEIIDEKTEDTAIQIEVQDLMQKINNNKKLRSIIEKFDKASEDISLEEILTKNLEMLEEVKKANKDRDEYLSILQRYKADFENYKKRTENKANYNIQLSSERILSKIFEPIEDINRALNFAQENKQETIPKDGIEIIYNKLSRVLQDEGVEEINPKQGEMFDPKYHEALCLDHSGKFDPDLIVQVFERGYKAKERVLRAAKVMISAAKPKETSEESEEVSETEKQKENIGN
jgi:molecular chaperone GrpE